MNMQIPNNPRQHSNKKLISRVYIIIGIILALLLAIGFIWSTIWLARTQAPTIEAVRDILIIALALESCVFGLVLMILLVMVIRLVNIVEFEIKPILEKTNETIGMVRGTTVFMSQNVVKPVTKATSIMAGIRRGYRALFGDPRKNLTD
ncbi:MAG: hypothetical protein D6706_05880 [Chloroflexi bacterium]|nr:MAG: hypothetical protein D6706_05880 [Chloroflexota bacterium]